MPNPKHHVDSQDYTHGKLAIYYCTLHLLTAVQRYYPQMKQNQYNYMQLI